MGQDPRVEAVADPICRMLGHGPLDRAPLMVADAVRGRAREFLAAADAAAWQSLDALWPGVVNIELWSPIPQTGMYEYPGGGWTRRVVHGIDNSTIGVYRELGYTHWRSPSPPPPSPAVPLDGEGEQDAAEPTEDEVERAARAMIAEMSLRLAMVVEISLHRDEGDPTDWADLSEDDRRAAMQVARAALIAARSRT